jgi:hypothetical protein
VFFRRLRQSKLSLILLVFTLINTSINSAAAAPVILNSSLGTGCAQTYGLGLIYTNRYVATKNIEISAINFLTGTQSTANFNSTRLYIFSDSATANYPETITSTFNPEAIYGSNETTTARFTGSQSIMAGSKFWIVPSVRASVFPRCYFASASITQMNFNGVVPDTSTSGSNSLFARAYSTDPSPISASWSASNTGQIWQLSIEAQLTPVSAAIALQNGSTLGKFRITSPIVVSVDIPSKVTFYARGKVIANCRNILSISGTATCNWRPSFTGSVPITARVNPLDLSSSNPTTISFQVSISKRSTFR